MQVNSAYPQKFPYTSEQFRKDAADFLDSQGEIGALELNQREKYLSSEMKINASYEKHYIYESLGKLLDKIFRFGSKEALKDNYGNKLSEKLDDALEGIYNSAIDEEPISALEGGTTKGSDHGTGIDSDSIVSKDQPLSDEQKAHAKGLVFNLLRDFVLERNFETLGPRKSFTKKDTAWDYSFASITGDHTRSVNSDAVSEHKNGSHILAAIADGITNTTNPIDRKEKNNTPKSERKAIYERNKGAYASHYTAKILTDTVTQSQISQAFYFSSQENSYDLRFEEAFEKLKKKPDYFWNLLASFAKQIDINTAENIYEAFSDFVNANPQIKDQIEEDYSLKGFADIIKNPELQKYFAAVAPVFAQREQIEDQFTKIYANQDGQSASGGAQLAYAIDIGDQVALVRIGDSPIKAFAANGETLDTQDTNFNLETKIRANVNLEYNHATKRSRMSFLGNPVIEFYDKKKLNTIVMSSDGLFKQQDTASQTDFASIIESIMREYNSDPRSIIAKVLRDHQGKDDRSIFVLQQLVKQ